MFVSVVLRIVSSELHRASFDLRNILSVSKEYDIFLQIQSIQIQEQDRTMQPQQIQLNLNEMSISEKLITINQIWDTLLQHSDSVPSPAWHREILISRSARVNDGVSHFKDFSSVKQELQSKFK